MIYNALEKMQNLPAYKGAIGSSVSLASFVVSKATHVETLQVVTLWIGALTAVLTAVSLILTIDKKLRDRKQELKEEKKKRLKILPLLLCSFLLTSCATTTRAPVPSTRPAIEQVARVDVNVKSASKKAAAATAKVKALPQTAAVKEIEVELVELTSYLDRSAESVTLLSGTLTSLTSDVEKLGKDRDELSREVLSLKPTLERWRKAALLAVAFSGLLVLWIFRKPALAIARRIIGLP